MKNIDIPKRTFYELQTEDAEGMVFLGCGGNLKQWESGIKEELQNGKMTNMGPIMTDPSDFFENVYYITTTGGRTDLVFPFKEGKQIPISKLAIWRLRFGSCSWISDYIVNYADQNDKTPPTPPTLPLDLDDLDDQMDSDEIPKEVVERVKIILKESEKKERFEEEKKRKFSQKRRKTSDTQSEPRRSERLRLKKERK